jgi:hypothetical protein
MNIAEIYSLYKNGVGTPGETARTLTKELVRLQSTNQYTIHEICQSILTIRFDIYKGMGIETITQSLIQRTLTIADGYFPFILFVDTFVANHNNHIDNLDAMMGTLTILLNVIVDEYNGIVDQKNQIEDQSILIDKVAVFLKMETGIDLYED